MNNEQINRVDDYTLEVVKTPEPIVVRYDLAELHAKREELINEITFKETEFDLQVNSLRADLEARLAPIRAEVEKTDALISEGEKLGVQARPVKEEVVEAPVEEVAPVETPVE